MTMNQPSSPISADTARRMALQMTAENIGPCHRQALWCGNHMSVWPHGQTGGCNEWITTLQACSAVVASAHRG